MKAPFKGQSVVVPEDGLGTVDKCYVNWKGEYKIAVYVKLRGHVIDFDPSDVQCVEVVYEEGSTRRRSNARESYIAERWDGKIAEAKARIAAETKEQAAHRDDTRQPLVNTVVKPVTEEVKKIMHATSTGRSRVVRRR